MFRGFFSALLPCRGWHVPRRRQPSPVPHTSLISSSSFFALFPQLRTRNSSRYYRLSKVSFWDPMQGVFPGADEGCTFGSRCLVSSRWSLQGLRPGRRGRLSAKEPMKGLRPGLLQDVRPGADEVCPFWADAVVSFRGRI